MLSEEIYRKQKTYSLVNIVNNLSLKSGCFRSSSSSRQEALKSNG